MIAACRKHTAKSEAMFKTGIDNQVPVLLAQVGEAEAHVRLAQRAEALRKRREAANPGERVTIGVEPGGSIRCDDKTLSDAAALVKHLKARGVARKTVIVIQAHTNTPYNHITKLLDAFKAAGYWNVSLTTQAEHSQR